MWQAKIVVRLIEGELGSQAFLAFAQRHHAPPDGSHMLSNRQIDPFNEGGVDLPSLRGEHVLHAFQCPAYDPVADVDQPSPSIRLDNLGIAQLGQRYPAGLRRGAYGSPARRLYPLAHVGQQRCGILLEPIGEKQRHTAGRQPLHDLMDQALRYRERALTDVDRQQQLADRVDRDPDPAGRALQTLDGPSFWYLAGFHRAEHGI